MKTKTAAKHMPEYAQSADYFFDQTYGPMCPASEVVKILLTPRQVLTHVRRAAIAKSTVERERTWRERTCMDQKRKT